MNRDELIKKFEKNVEYLKRNVPPDDIYEFAEQTFMAAYFFIKKWAEWVDPDEEAQKDLVVRKWITNILSLHLAREDDVDVQLDLRINGEKDDEIDTSG